MTQHEIVALRCPSCGEGINQPSREMPFGAEFRCDGCDITSVLIVNRDLVPLNTLLKLGEKVCTTCGRIAQREARFCQDGHPLIRKCIKCLTEFAVDHKRCDSCGWNQNVTPDTEAGESLIFDRAVSDLDDPDIFVVEKALKVIEEGAGTASLTAKKTAAHAIHRLMKDTAFRQRVQKNKTLQFYTERSFWLALGKLGPADQEAIPVLLQRIEEFWPPKNEHLDDYHHGTEAELLSCFCSILPDDAVPILKEGIEELVSDERGAYRADIALSALAAISPDDAVSVLRELIEKYWARGWWENRNWVSLLGKLSLKDALAYCSRGLTEMGKDDANTHEVVRSAFDLGKDAIPMLEKFCGMFSGRKGRECSAAISCLRNGETILKTPGY